MDVVKKYPTVTILISAIIIRIILLFADFSFDVHNHIGWGKDMVQRGFSGFYDAQSSEVYASLYPNYPPVINYVFSLIYLVYIGIVNTVLWLNTTVPIFPSKLVFFIESRTFAAGLFKLPAIFADFGIAWILYLFARKIIPAKENLKPFIYGFILLNPAVFYNSAFWGQIDSIPLFFALSAFYLLWYTNRFIASAIIFMLALLVKPTVIIFLPLFVGVFFIKRNTIDTIKAFGVSILFFWLSFLPFYKVGNLLFFPFNIYNQKILAAQSLAYVTNGAFNFWLPITRYEGIKDTEQLFLLSYQWWGYLITTGFFLALFFVYSKKKNNIEAFLYTAFLMAFAAVMFLTKMHERYTMLMLPFLLLLALKKPALLKWYIALSVISFLNLFHSWQAIPVEIFKIIISYTFTGVLLSVWMIFIFIYFFVRFILVSQEKGKQSVVSSV